VQERKLPQGGTGWETGRGRLGLWVPARQVLIIHLEKHGEGEFAERIIPIFDQLLTSTDRVHVFFHMPMMRTYDSKLRTALTDRFLPDLKRLAALHTLTGSRIVAMGVAVANLALGRIITVHRAADTFMDALRLAGATEFLPASFERVA
jgi:hypothetical protein